MLPIEMEETERKSECGEEERGPDRVGLETLAGRLSRRGGSTPPEGDLGARLRELSGNGEVGCTVVQGGKGGTEGITEWDGRGSGRQGGRANVVPLSRAAPAARRVIASPRQASRVRPLLHTVPSGPPSPSWRSVGPPAHPGSLSLSLLDARDFLGPRRPRSPYPIANESLTFVLADDNVRYERCLVPDMTVLHAHFA